MRFLAGGFVGTDGPAAKTLLLGLLNNPTVELNADDDGTDGLKLDLIELKLSSSLLSIANLLLRRLIAKELEDAKVDVEVLVAAGAFLGAGAEKTSSSSSLSLSNDIVVLDVVLGAGSEKVGFARPAPIRSKMPRDSPVFAIIAAAKLLGFDSTEFFFAAMSLTFSSSLSSLL